jgi:hypothetical protein
MHLFVNLLLAFLLSHTKCSSWLFSKCIVVLHVVIHLFYCYIEGCVSRQ